MFVIMSFQGNGAPGPPGPSGNPGFQGVKGNVRPWYAPVIHMNKHLPWISLHVMIYIYFSFWFPLYPQVFLVLRERQVLQVQ